VITKRLMKPVIAATLVAILLSFTAASFAQERRHDLSVQFGVLSPDQLIDVFGNLGILIITLGNFYKDNMQFSGIPVLTYHYSANSRFGFGGAFGYYGSWGDLVIEGGDVVVGDFHERNYTLAAELDYHWVMRPGLQVYSGAGFGLRIRRGRYTDADETVTRTWALPTFNITALGVRFGRKIGFFAEAGAGYKGMLSVGINGQF
jgi:hypothetical protein